MACPLGLTCLARRSSDVETRGSLVAAALARPAAVYEQGASLGRNGSRGGMGGSRSVRSVRTAVANL